MSNSTNETGRVRFWAEVWLSPEEAAALAALASDRKKGTKQVLGDLATTTLVPEVVKLGSALAQAQADAAAAKQATVLAAARAALEAAGFQISPVGPPAPEAAPVAADDSTPEPPAADA